jgi:hypothetical protein
MFGAIGMLAGSYITGKGPLEVMTGGGTVVFYTCGRTLAEG